MDKLQRYLSLPISVAVLQYNVVNPEELPDGSEEFTWVYKYHNTRVLYRQLAGLGKIRNMTAMDQRIKWVDGSEVKRIIAAIVNGTRNVAAYEMMMDGRLDWHEVVVDNYALSMSTITIANNDADLTFAIINHHPSISHECIDLILFLNNYQMLAKLYISRRHMLRAVMYEDMLSYYDEDHPFNRKEFMKHGGSDINIKQFHIYLAMKMLRLGVFRHYWVHVYKLLDKVPRHHLVLYQQEGSYRFGLNTALMHHLRNKLQTK